MTFPLADTRTAGVCHDGGTELFKVTDDTVTFGCITDLFRSRIDDQRGSDRYFIFKSLPGDRGGTA